MNERMSEDQWMRIYFSIQDGCETVDTVRALSTFAREARRAREAEEVLIAERVVLLEQIATWKRAATIAAHALGQRDATTAAVQPKRPKRSTRMVAKGRSAR